jgi:hypothetical protein
MEICVAIYACELPPALLKYSSRKTVLLWGHENLLGYSVELLLNAANDLDLVKVSADQGVDGLVAQVESIHPDVVIIYQLNSAFDPHLMTRLMQNQLWLKVVLVHLESNSVEIFNKQKVWINESPDLLSIVKGCPRLPCANE